MEANPAGIYFTPKVVNPFVRNRFSKPNMTMVNHSLRRGQVVFLKRKKRRNRNPASSNLMADNCSAGMAATPCREATQVVPHKKLTAPSAMKGFILFGGILEEVEGFSFRFNV